MECSHCGTEMNKSDMVKELAELRGWTEGKEYAINESWSSTTINIKKPGVEDLLQEERQKDEPNEA